MCGICGYLEKNINKEYIYSMNNEINHRGPDAEGCYFNNNAALGHKRLKIIDLVTGEQPIFNSDKSLVIIFNGEIYNFKNIKTELIKKNHSFKTSSDTEVILHAYEEWGVDSLKKLNGMFAFAILNTNNNELFLARDRFGQKPLFYYHKNDTFIFASELTSLMKHPAVKKNINVSGLQQYLFYEYIPAPTSIIDSVNKLQAGHYLIYKDNRIYISQYWDIKFNTISNIITENEIKENVIELLKKSIHLRLISDVPLGIFLSGGIDSSTIVALLSEMTDIKKVKTFSIGFEEKSYDERNFARIIAEKFGTDHKEEILSPKNMIEIIPDIINKLDEPFADSSIVPTYLLSKFTKQYVTVALGGDGGDELFAGYDPFLAHWLLRNFKIPKELLNIIIRIIHNLVPVSNKNMSLEFRIKRTLTGLYASPEIRNELWMSAFSYDMQKELFLEKAKIDEQTIFKPITSLNYKNKTLIQKIIYLYSKVYLQNDILAKVDKASMMNSLEVRAPFLDVDFAEYVNNLPDKYKLRYGKRKYLIKNIMEDKLPYEIIHRQKKGFGIPVNKWFKSDLKDLLKSTLNKKRISEDGIFNYEYIDNLINEHLNNKKNNSKELWSLLIFQLWKNKLNKNSI
jgi:asparagine synthase (glutamine-hydrolysing)